jgi:energy-coupling factor transporter ATP-binding protein EcfA2
MSELRALQRSFSALLFQQNDESFVDRIVSDEIAAEDRLQIHQNNMRITLTDALGSIYPVFHKLVESYF